jgi:hypothetical protein
MQDHEKSGEDWISEAKHQLQQRYDLIRCAGGPIPSLALGIKPPLNAREAEYFVRGLEAGLFSIDDESYVQSSMLPASSRTDSRNRILQLFWRRAGQRYLFREGICQLSTVATLRLNYNWPEDKIKMEPTFPEQAHLPWAVDILMLNAQGTVAALCEVKRDKRELDQLVRGFQHCCREGPHTKQGKRPSKPSIPRMDLVVK